MLKLRRAYKKDGTFRDLSYLALDLGTDRDAIATFFGSYPPAYSLDSSITDQEVLLEYTPTDVELAAEFAIADAVRVQPGKVIVDANNP